MSFISTEQAMPVALQSPISKRVVDFLLACCCLVCFSPLMVLIALLILSEGRGNVFFRQRRIGLRGRVFWIWKFRTMVVDAEERFKDVEQFNESYGGLLFKMKNDPRVTFIGHYLRKWSLDEIPQLINVLRGEMSFVGPRPLPLRDCLKLTLEDEAGFARRMEVLPGITGLWQVNGRSDIGGAEMLSLDIEYVDNYSFKNDIDIILRTIVALVFKRHGAY